MCTWGSRGVLKHKITQSTRYLTAADKHFEQDCVLGFCNLAGKVIQNKCST